MPIFPKISVEFITRFRCYCIAPVAVCDSARCTPFMTSQRSLWRQCCIMTSYSSMSKLSEVARQHLSKNFTPIIMYSVWSNISMKLLAKCTVPVGSSRYTQVVTFAWWRAKAKAVTLASGGETTDYFYPLPNESWNTEILIFSICCTEKQERWNIHQFISMNVLKK